MLGCWNGLYTTMNGERRQAGRGVPAIFGTLCQKAFCALPRFFCLPGSLAFRLLPPSRPAYLPRPLRGHPYRPACSSLPQPYASLRRVNRAWFKDKTKTRFVFVLSLNIYPVTGRSEPKGGRAKLAEALGAKRPQGRDSRMGRR
jgi:hypothetical protein